MYGTCKLFKYAYVIGSLNTTYTTGEVNHCEAEGRSLQSPHVKNIDIDTVDGIKFSPITTCSNINADKDAQKKIILECLRAPKQWLKI